MTDTGPLWLRIVTTSIPLLAALIAGVFALTNTVNRRIERLKNLVEIRDNYPDPLNPGYALERIMLQELYAIDLATTPLLKWHRRFRVAAIIVVAGFYIAAPLNVLHVGNSRATGLSMAAFGFLIGFGILIDTNILHKSRKQFQTLYGRKLNTLHELAVEAEEPSSGDSGPEDAPEHESSADDVSDEPPPKDSDD